MTELLCIEGLTKRFPGVVALDDVDFTLAPGEVHAVVGHNGAGKSTLVKTIAGDYGATARTFRIAGQPVDFRSPADALQAGARLVTQERALVPSLTVEENILLGHLPAGRMGRVDWTRMRARTRELLTDLGVMIDPAEIVGRLRPPEQTLVEIARALSQDARILILDEPTSTLSDQETSRLFGIVRRLVERGAGVILISHRVADILAIADRVSVLRDGRVVFGSSLAGLSAAELVREMTGQAAEPAQILESEAERAAQDVVLVARDLTVDGVVEGVSLDVRAGEIVGAFGLVGSGATELPYALFRALPSRGTVSVGEREVSTVRGAARLGMGLVPADRGEGILALETVRRNLGVANLAAYAPFGLYRRGLETRAARNWIDRLSILPAAPSAICGTLSGGNQQKTMLGRWLERGAKVLLLSEPTRGVDVTARAAIHSMLVKLRDSGVAILLASSDLDEVVGISDRIVVFSKGRVVGEFPGGPSAMEPVLHAAAT